MNKLEEELWNVDESRDLTKEELDKINSYDLVSPKHLSYANGNKDNYGFLIYRSNTGSKVYVPRSFGDIYIWAKFRKQMGLPL